eukprot:gnl/MRDRNA2_/MRDRNA2_94510_c0_seq1.p1 gnl/MRDRNA2_/MRDRNA2_94510_c0~~gnl/MRDRNA2_/MRDRNA2_94510_c0_seq1.p1  ORF type:complete len:1915 (-),score=470.90 gnl/MRDRNA2_/MRDRNA2_94510_c0_seq1:122-5782(-)
MPLPQELLEHLHMVETTATPEDSQLGLTPTFPPGPVMQKNDPPHGTWADSHGFKAGSVIVFINHEYAEDMTQAHVISSLKSRPLHIVFAPPMVLGQEIKKLGVGFNKPSSGRVRVGTVAPGGWGESAGLVPGDVLMTVNHQITEKLEDKDFIHALQNRPVTMGIVKMRMSLLMEIASTGRLEMERDEIEIELTNLQGHVKDLEEDKYENEHKIQEQLHELEQLHDQLHAAESAGGDAGHAAEVAATNMGLRGELNELVLKTEADADALEGLELQLKQAQEDIAALEKELDDAREQQPPMERENSEALHIISGDYNEAMVKLQKAEEARNELQEEFEQAKEENKLLKSKSPPDVKTLHDQIDKLKNENKQLKSQGSSEEEIRQLRAENEQLKSSKGGTGSMSLKLGKGLVSTTSPSVPGSATVSSPQILMDRFRGQLNQQGFLGKEQMQDHIKTVFSTIDKDGSGAVELMEFESFLRMLKLDMGSAECCTLFQTLDKDASGCIKCEELLMSLDTADRTSQATMSQVLLGRIRHHLGKRTPNEQKLFKNVRQMFNDVDHDGSGEIDRAEFERLAIKMQFHVTTTELDVLYTVFDIEGKGKVSFDEFLSALKMADRSKEKKLSDLLLERIRGQLRSQGYSGDKFREKLYDLYSAMDTDDSGELDLREFESLVTKLQLSMSPPEVHVLFGIFDSDDKGVVSFEQFAAHLQGGRFLLERMREQLQKRGLAGEQFKHKLEEVFAHHDKDGGGEVDVVEFMGMIQRLGLFFHDAEISLLFNFFDRDSGGSLSLEEFIGELQGPAVLLERVQNEVATRAWASQSDKIKRVWASISQENDMFADDLEKLAKELQIQLSPAEIRVLIGAVGDVSTGIVEVNRFLDAVCPDAPAPVDEKERKIICKIQGQVAQYGLQDQSAMFHDMFSKIDQDGSGSIDLQEFDGLVNDLQLGLTTTETRVLFETFDKTGLGAISFDDFAASVQTKGATMSTQDEISALRADLRDVQRQLEMNFIAQASATDQITSYKSEIKTLKDNLADAKRSGGGGGGGAAPGKPAPQTVGNAQQQALINKLRSQIIDKGYFFVLERLRKIFKEVDKDGSGELEWKEFEAMIHLLQLDLTNTDVRMLFSTFDDSGDGSISFDEFSSAFKPNAKPPKSERQRILVEKLRDKFTKQGLDDQLSKFRQLFVDVDDRNNGLIDLVKFQNVCLTFGLQVDPKEAKEIFNAFDPESTKSISYNEVLGILGPSDGESNENPDDAKMLRKELDKAVDALEAERARTTAALQMRVGPQGQEEVKALRMQLASVRDELDASLLEQATAVDPNDVKEGLRWAQTAKQYKAELDEARVAQQKQTTKLATQSEAHEKAKEHSRQELKAAKAESKSLEDEIARAQKQIRIAELGGQKENAEMAEEAEEHKQNSKKYMAELYTFEANARAAIREAKQKSAEAQDEAKHADALKTELEESTDKLHEAVEKQRASMQLDVDELRAQLDQEHRKFLVAESDTLKQEVHMESIIHNVEADNYKEETAAAVLRNAADPIFEIEFQILRDEYVQAKAQAKAYKAAHNAPQAHLIGVLRDTEFAEESEYQMAKQLRTELASARDELAGILVQPPPSPNKYTWTGQRKTEVSVGKVTIPNKAQQALKLPSGITESLTSDQVQKLQESVMEAAVIGASARRDFVDGGGDGTGNVDALQSALNEAMQAQESWAKATALMESATGVQLSKSKSDMESNRNFQLKSEVESLWLALNDQKSEFKSYEPAPPAEYQDGVLGHVPAPRRPRNFPIQDTPGGPRAPGPPGSGLETRAQRIRKEAEDLHAEIGRWRAGHGAPLAMNRMRERRGAPPVTGSLGSYEETPLIPFRQEDLDSVMAIRAGAQASVELLPLVPSVVQKGVSR